MRIWVLCAGTPLLSADCTPPSVAEWEVTTGTGGTGAGAGDSVTGGSFLLRHQTRRRRLWRSWERGERGATHQQKFATFYRARDVLPPVGLGSSRRPELSRKWEWSPGILTNANTEQFDTLTKGHQSLFFSKIKCLDSYLDLLSPILLSHKMEKLSNV